MKFILLPILLIMFTVISIIFTGVLSKPAIAADLKSGEVLYQKHCMACHQKDGSGIATLYPALKGNSRVDGDVESLLKVVLMGDKGPLSEPKDKFMGAMAAYTYLADEEIADIVTYIRTTFGENQEVVTAKEVETVRVSLK